MTNKNQLIAQAPAQNTSTNVDGFENSPKNLQPDGAVSLDRYDDAERRKLLRRELKAIEKEESLVKNIRVQPLYQSKPLYYETYIQHINRSFTDSLESYQNGADKTRKILQWNMQHYKREPKKELILHFLLELSAFGIHVLRKHIFAYLKKNGIRAITNIELTREKPRVGKPNNRVHFHILTDDSRSEDELRALFRTACERCGLTKKDYRIDYSEINNAHWYFEYFTKYDSKAKAEIKSLKENKNKIKNQEKPKKWDRDRDWSWKTVLLFRKYTGLAKFKPIGDWFEKSQEEIWKEIQTYMRNKDEVVK